MTIIDRDLSRAFRSALSSLPASDGRRKDWSRSRSLSRKKRKTLSKVARRKTLRLLTQVQSDWMREEFNRESFARQVLPPKEIYE